MPADPGYKRLRATDVEFLMNLLYVYAEDGESFVDTVRRLRRGYLANEWRLKRGKRRNG